MDKQKETPKISVVVPFYNEEDSVEELHTKLTRVLQEQGMSYEMIFIDDGSTDGTSAILKKLFARDKSLKVIKLRKNFGQTAALQAGFDHAQGEIIISMDGDLQHDPEDIPIFLEKMKEGYDIVSGWRKKRKDHFLLRRFPSWVANRIMRLLSGVKIHDFGTTFKAYRKDVLEGVKLYGELHRFIPALISRTGVTITEVPIKNIIRPKGKSKYGLSRVRRVFFDLMTVKFIISFIDRPLQFFGLIGLVLGSIGFFIALVLTLGFYIAGWSIRDNLGNLILAVFLMILGLQFIMTGLLAEIISRIYFTTHEMRIYSIREIQSHPDADAKSGI
jgi:glycosyltransferase involved in cell wall biosynthesis